MPTFATLLQNDPNVQEFALKVLRDCDDLREFSAKCLEAMLNSAMSAEADEVCNASYGERTDERVNSRNGYRERSLETTSGDITLEIPKLRHGTYYPEGIIEHYRRADTALALVAIEMYANGISTRKMKRVMKRLGVDSMSKSQVSELCKAIDEEVERLRTSSLLGHIIRYVWIDATYVSCRVDGRFVSVAVVTAIGLDEDGRRRFLGIDVFDTENYEDWRKFLQGLKDRGLNGVRLVVSDAHAGIVRAVRELFQGACWQRCITHLMRNAANAEGNELKRTIARECLKATFAQNDPTLVRACYRATVDRLVESGCNKSAELLANAENDALAYLQFPVAHRRKIRTNNIQERANREIKRRTDSVQCFPDKASVVRLVGAVLVEETMAWQMSPRVFTPESVESIDDYVAPEATDAQRRDAEARAREIIAEAHKKALDKVAPKK